ncbi:MAG TPA: helix-turn-helix domain-containing protein [Nocardioidaceae bacterium]|nr:helix-turn-helix domain-containing protein [Nocardioidaceae bacterium]
MYSLDVRRQALHLLQSGASLSDVSRRTGIARSTLRSWRDGPSTPVRVTLCAVEGSADPLDRRRYAALLGFYLGDGCVSAARTTFTLRISCDAGQPGVIEDVTRTMQAVRGRGTICHVRAPGVVVVQSSWKHWPCLFPQHGPGRKHERRLVLAAWQREVVEAYPGDFLRGLFHSDGSRVRNWARRTVDGVTTRHEYARWQFVNNSAEILGWCTEALDLVGIPWRQSSWKCVSVSTRDGVAALDALIGPKT